MDLFIRIQDGQPVDHPILGDNFREVFPDIDPDNLPPEFAPFDRVDPSDIPVGVYEVLVENYVWNGSRVTDDWTTRPMTDDEKAAKIAENQAAPHPNDWVFNETTCRWEPDLSKPGSAPNVIE